MFIIHNLNAIQDLNGSLLYLIDLSSKSDIGECVRTLFPNLLSEWTLYTDNVSSKFMEEIGNDINMV